MKRCLLRDAAFFSPASRHGRIVGIDTSGKKTSGKLRIIAALACSFSRNLIRVVSISQLRLPRHQSKRQDSPGYGRTHCDPYGIDPLLSLGKLNVVAN